MHFRARLGNQSIDFSDFWYKTSLIYYFEYGIGSSARKEKIGPKMAKKGVKNMHFQAFLDNQSLDLPGFGMCMMITLWTLLALSSLLLNITFPTICILILGSIIIS